jgi:hypothetical protein
MSHRHHEHPSASTCYICNESAKQLCERCQKYICPTHTHSRMRLHWEFQASIPDWYGFRSTWYSYVPTGGVWKVCPECLDAVVGEDARELAKDRRSQRWRVLEHSLGLAALVLLMILSAYYSSGWHHLP